MRGANANAIPMVIGCCRSGQRSWFRSGDGSGYRMSVQVVDLTTLSRRFAFLILALVVGAVSSIVAAILLEFRVRFILD